MLEIFEYLTPRDLIALSAVSRVFNDVISNTKLVRKLTLNFRKLNGDEESIGERQYTRLKIGFFKSATHYSILKDIGDNLTTLSFVNYKFKLDTIRRILNETPNVEDLRFERVTLSDVPNVLKQPQPQLKLKNLTSIISDPKLFRALQSCSVEELSVTQHECDNYVNFIDLIQLIRSQTNLTSLTLNSFCNTSLFSDNSLERVNFKLEKFSLGFAVFFKTVHLKRFVEAHIDSLTHFEMNDCCSCDFSLEVNQMRNLKSLKVSDVSMNYLELLPSVEELSLASNTIPETFFENLPNLKSLELKRVNKKKILLMITELTTLESLEVKEGIIDELLLPSLRKLSLFNIRDCPPTFFGFQFNVEELYLEDCRFVDDETIDDIVSCLTKLKSLVVIATKKNCCGITNNGLATIRDRCESLKLLRISGASTQLDWKILENKNMQIYI